MRCISDLMCWISSYTIARWCGSTYSSWCSSSQRLICSHCNCSLRSNTAKVLSWKPKAHTDISTYSMKAVRKSILLFKGRGLSVYPFPLHSRAHHTPVLDHSVRTGSHVVCQQIPDPTARSNDALECPSDT